MRKYYGLAIAAIIAGGAVALWSNPTVPATHSYVQSISTPSAMGVRASDRLIEAAAAEEARAVAAQRLARHYRPSVRSAQE
jgi:hypothetical protein